MPFSSTHHYPLPELTDHRKSHLTKLAPLATDGGLKLDVCRKNLDRQQNQRQKLSWCSLKVEILMF